MKFLEELHEIPKDALNLIIYYSLCMTETVGLFMSIYMFALGMDVIIVGALYTYYYLLTGIANFIIGRFLDIRIAPKYLVIVIEILGIIEWITVANATSPFHFMIVFFISAIYSPFFVAYRTLERDIYPEEKIEMIYKHHMFWPYFIQFLLLPIFGVYLSTNFIIRYRRLIYIAILVSVFRIFFVAYKIPTTRPKKELKDGNNTVKNNDSIFKIHKKLNKKAIMLLIAEIIMLLGFGIAPFFILENYLYNILGSSIFNISLIYSVGGLLGALGALAYHALENQGNLRLLMVTLIIFIISSIGLFLIQFYNGIFLLILLLIALMYLANTIWWIIHESLIMTNIDKEIRGTIFGTVAMIRNLLMIPLPTISAILTKISPLLPYLIQGILFATTIPIYYFVLKK